MTTGGPSNPDSKRGPDPLPPKRADGPPAGTPDHLVDAFFDRELDPQRSRDLLAGLKHDAPRSEEIARTQRMLSMLRRTPMRAERAEDDLVDAILARVDRKRRFLPDFWRRFVTAGRLATAATVLLAGMGVAVLGRTHPEMLRLAPQPAPIATLVDVGQTEVSQSAERCSGALEAISDQAAAPLRQFTATIVRSRDVVGSLGAPSDPLRPGELATVRFIESDTELRLSPGSGEPAAGPLGASFGLGLEMVSSRQRSGESAPVFVSTYRTESRTGQSALVGSTVRAPLSGKSIGLAAAACQSVTVGDHTVLLPADLDPRGWTGGPGAAYRILLIQASPLDQFPSR